MYFYISDDWSGDEESASEKISRKHELSERLSPQKEIQKASSVNPTETTVVNKEAPENQTDVESRVSGFDHVTDKEQTPSEKGQKSEDSSETTPQSQESTKRTSNEKDLNDSIPQIVHESEKSDSEITGSSQSQVLQEIPTIVKDSSMTTDQSKTDMAEKEVKTKDKEDMVVINPDRVTPDSNKGSLSLSLSIPPSLSLSLSLAPPLSLWQIQIKDFSISLSFWVQILQTILVYI